MSVPTPNPVDLLIDRAIDVFHDHFDTLPNIGARAPGRVRLTGDHVDRQGGVSLTLAINRWTVMVAKINHSKRCRVVAADRGEEMATFLIDRPPDAGRTRWSNYIKGVIHAVKSQGHPIPGFDAVVVSDIPTGYGLGSSAALEVATLTLVEMLMAIRIPTGTKARWCRQAEQEFMGVPCGLSDQWIAINGQFGCAHLLETDQMTSRSVPLDDPSLTMMVCHTGQPRQDADARSAERAAEIDQAEQILSQAYPQIPRLLDARLNDIEAIREELGDVLFRRARHMILEQARAGMVAQALDDGRFDVAGFLLHESHRSLRNDFDAVPDDLEAVVQMAIGLKGVFGARMIGGGWGGCVLVLIDHEHVAAVVEQLRTGFEQAHGKPLEVERIRAADGCRPLTM